MQVIRQRERKTVKRQLHRRGVHFFSPRGIFCGLQGPQRRSCFCRFYCEWVVVVALVEPFALIVQRKALCVI